MPLAEGYQPMTVTADTTIHVAGAAASVSEYELPTFCTGSHTTSPPPMTPVTDPAGNTLCYELSSSALTPILDAVQSPSLCTQLSPLARETGMPEEMFTDTVTQYATWMAIGADTDHPFTLDTIDSLLKTRLTEAGKKVSDEERKKYVSAIWTGVDLTLKSAFPDGVLPSGVAVETALQEASGG